MAARSTITGMVLAGGRGTRMGGLDKGLQPFRSVPLARHAALRLSPQVAHVAINANRHLALYESWGWPVWADADPDSFQGPLAGMLSGLSRMQTEWLVTVPCDAPDFPLDLVERLASAAATAKSSLAYASSPGAPGATSRQQPAFCLVHGSLRNALQAHVEAGGRKVMDWLSSQSATETRFDDEAAFANVNTRDELARSEQARP